MGRAGGRHGLYAHHLLLQFTVWERCFLPQDLIPQQNQTLHVLAIILQLSIILIKPLPLVLYDTINKSCFTE